MLDFEVKYTDPISQRRVVHVKRTGNTIGVISYKSHNRKYVIKLLPAVTLTGSEAEQIDAQCNLEQAMLRGAIKPLARTNGERIAVLETTMSDWRNEKALLENRVAALEQWVNYLIEVTGQQGIAKHDTQK